MNYLSKVYLTVLAPVTLLTAGLSYASAALAGDIFTPNAAQQVELGKRAAADLRQSHHVLPASDWRVQALHDVAHHLLGVTDLNGAPWKFSFDVIESNEVNAFALPGGPVFFYTGLFAKLHTEDELAGVLGHEMTHVLKEHWAKAYGEKLKRDLGIAVILSLLHAGHSLVDLANISDELLFTLPNSRGAESEADDGGFTRMIAAGYNPQGEADVFRMLANLGGNAPEWLSDHPDSAHRVARIKQKILDSHRNYSPQKPLH